MTAIATIDSVQTLGDMIRKHSAALLQGAAQGITLDHLWSAARVALMRDPKMRNATAASVLGALRKAARLGLDPSGDSGEAYLVAYKNHGLQECQLVLGYRGCITLARRGGNVGAIEAENVFEGERFSFSRTESGARLRHYPGEHRDDPAKITHSYAVAQIRGFPVGQVDVMTRAEIDKIRNASRASKPWSEHFSEMARKTPTRRLCKYLPITVEAQRAITDDDKIDSGLDPSKWIDGATGGSSNQADDERAVCSERIEMAETMGQLEQLAEQAQKLGCDDEWKEKAATLSGQGAA